MQHGLHSTILGVSDGCGEAGAGTFRFEALKRILAIAGKDIRVIEPDAELLQIARDAAERAYAKYSNFRVGAAVRVGDAVYHGCNIENASYGLTICAERVAIFTAIASGAKQIDALALACVDADQDSGGAGLMPCGACRQVMAEFGSASLPVHVDRAGTFTLSQLLPNAFTLKDKGL